MRNPRACLLMMLAVTSVASSARANPEPTAYDQRSIAMGLTGTSFLERPAALALNPANLEGIEKFGVSIMFNMLFVNQRAPVEGPDNPSIDSGIGLGPLGSVFLAGRIAPRVVFGGGFYIETGYGSSFDDVENVDGAGQNPLDDQGNPIGQDQDVTFFIGEVAFGPSIRLSDEWRMGLAVRIPFSKQVASLYQNVGAELGTELYSRVENDLGGIGFPSLRFGLTFKPNDKWSIGAMYRMYTKIKLSGTTETDLFPDPLEAEADWTMPHAFQAGFAVWPIPNFLIAAELRVQFHEADKHGNDAQVVTTPGLTTVVPFGWETVFSGKVGAEYSVNDLIDVRGGFNLAKSATNMDWAQNFTPPPGFNGFVSAGMGFNWEPFSLDFSGAFAFGGETIDRNYADENSPAAVPGTDPAEEVRLCSNEQVVRTACGGDYQVRTYWIGLQFTYQR